MNALIIGNGPSAISSANYGSKIDQFDGLVVRFNHCRVRGLEEFVGTRTDVWASGGSGGVRQLGQAKNLLATHIGFSRFASGMWGKFSDDGRSRESVSLETFQEVKKELGSYPSSGVLVTRHFQKKALHVSLHGFDFFNPSVDHHYFKPGKVTLSKHGHRPKNEASWFMQQIRTGKLELWHPEGVDLPDVTSLSHFGLLLSKLGLTGSALLMGILPKLLTDNLLEFSPLSKIYKLMPNTPITEPIFINEKSNSREHFAISVTELVDISSCPEDKLDMVYFGKDSSFSIKGVDWFHRLRIGGVIAGCALQGSNSHLPPSITEIARRWNLKLNYTKDIPISWWAIKKR